jgi:hypothetical protein
MPARARRTVASARAANGSRIGSEAALCRHFSIDTVPLEINAARFKPVTGRILASFRSELTSDGFEY